MDTFKSLGSGYLGTLINQVPHFETRVDRKHTVDKPFDVSKLAALPKIKILYDYQNDSGYLYDAAVANGARDIVVAGVGAGSESHFVLPAVKSAISKGVLVVHSSRTGSGYVPEDDSYLGLLGDNLNPQKARILLVLALTVTVEPAKIQQIFDTY